MTLVYGVDFGTSNSSIMVGRPGGRVVRIRNPVNSRHEVPSAVCLGPDGTMKVGSVATQMKLLRPAWYRQNFKRHIDDEVPYHFPAEKPGDPRLDPSYYAYELVAEVLRVLRQAAEREVQERPGLVVLTVPASWEAGKRDLMLEAADQAGFARETLRLVTEPEAAVAYAAQEHLGGRERTLLIYDLGGGTFDCAVVRGRGGLDFEVLGEAGGLSGIGGALFDQRIMSLVHERHPEWWRELMEGRTSDIQVLARRLQLRDTCEEAKWFLSSQDRYEGLLTGLGRDVDFVLTAGELAERLAPLIGRTLGECERVLGTQGMTWEDIDGVVPVGGSVRLPVVGEMIARRSSRGHAPVLRVDDPELAVVHGAVLHAFHLARGRAAPAPPPGRVPEAAAAPVETRAEEAPAVAPGPSASPESSGTPLEAAFHAVDADLLSTLRIWRRISYTSAAIAVLVLVLRPFGLHWNIEHGDGTLDGLQIGALTLMGVAVVSRALAAWVTYRMVTDVGSAVGATVVCGVSLAASGVTYHLWSGWGVLVVALLLIVAWLAAMVAVLDVSQGQFVTWVRVDGQGMAFRTGKGHVLNLAWVEVDTFIVKGSGLSRALYARLDDEKPIAFASVFRRTRAGAPETAHEYRLFDRLHFLSGDDLLDVIRANSGGRLTGTW